MIASLCKIQSQNLKCVYCRSKRRPSSKIGSSEGAIGLWLEVVGEMERKNITQLVASLGAVWMDSCWIHILYDNDKNKDLNFKVKRMFLDHLLNLFTLKNNISDSQKLCYSTLEQICWCVNLAWGTLNGVSHYMKLFFPWGLICYLDM